MENPFANYNPNLFPRLERAGQFIKGLVHFLPETPLASHGDTLPTALRVEPDVRVEANAVIN